MSAATIEHRAVVQQVEDGNALLALALSGCASCGASGGCGVGRMAGGRDALLLSMPVGEHIRAGDVLIVALPESRLTGAALTGYLMPLLAMLFGAGCGSLLGGSDAATALGAVFGFLGALAVGRLLAGRLPGLLPTPRLVRLASHSGFPLEELQHER